MGKTKIEWAKYTFNPWTGCQKVSPGCAHCYAETLSKRWGKGDQWGPQGQRQITSTEYWQQPLKWDAIARDAGEHPPLSAATPPSG